MLLSRSEVARFSLAQKALRRCKDALERAQELRESSRVGSCHDELGAIHERRPVLPESPNER